MKDKEVTQVIRNYKDTLFRKIFSDKTNLLSLYNMMSGKNYTDPDLLEIVTLDNAIYMNMKNDLAFLIDCSLHMYEHQSTLSPNLALRHLFYVTREYEKFTNMATLYSSKRVKLPAPHFVVFYNGTDGDWSIRTSKLSEAFEPQQESPNLELVVKEININPGRNDELLLQCKPLFEYMQYIDKVRTYAVTMSTELAVEKAVNESIQEGILKEFLLQNKSEAIQMSIFEFDEEREMKLIREDERELGREEGISIGREQGLAEGIQTSINLLVKYDLEHNIAEETIIQRIVETFGLEHDKVVHILQCIKDR